MESHQDALDIFPHDQMHLTHLVLKSNPMVQKVQFLRVQFSNFGAQGTILPNCTFLGYKKKTMISGNYREKKNTDRDIPTFRPRKQIRPANYDPGGETWEDEKTGRSQK